MTRLTEYTDKALSAVAYEMGINGSDITTRCSQREVVDARQMVIYALAEQGFTSRRIATQMCVTQRYVQHVISKFDDKMRYDKAFRNSYERVAQQLRNIDE